MKNLFVGAVVASPVIGWAVLFLLFPEVTGFATIGVLLLCAFWVIGDIFDHPISNGRHL